MREGWKYKKLTEITWFQEGPGVRNNQYKESGIKLLNVANLVDGHLDLSTSKRYISEEEAYGKYSHFLAEEGDFIIASSGIQVSNFDKKMGFVKSEHLPLCMNTSTIRFKVLDNDILDIKYLMYYFKSDYFKEILRRQITGSAQLNFGPSHLKKMGIPLPPKSQQEAIVSELNEINSLLALKREQLQKYDKLAQSLFYEMFGDPIENEKGWELKKLNEVSEIATGSTPSTSDESNWNGDINWVTPAELGVQLYYGETVRKITDKGAKGLTLMPKGTVLLSSRAPIGKLAITTEEMCCNQGFKNIICGSSLNNIYTYYYLLLVMDKIIALGRGATFKEVSKSAIGAFSISLPPLSLQQQFASRIEQIESQKQQVQAAIEKLETLLASRMQYWFE